VARPTKRGGWVNDSEPEAEFQETVNKSKARLKAVALAETFADKL
jgi:anthranilate/para-aminobenzoate synthase component I